MTLGTLWTPVEAVGIYVPGGTAAYPSSVLMNAVPARVAGATRIAMTVPTPRGEVNDAVLAHAREGARTSGRTFSMMYDLSGLGAEQMGRAIEDWRRLSGELRVTEDPRYLRHHGKPLVAVWGVGFNDQRKYTLLE